MQFLVETDVDDMLVVCLKPPNYLPASNHLCFYSYSLLLAVLENLFHFMYICIPSRLKQCARVLKSVSFAIQLV